MRSCRTTSSRSRLFSVALYISTHIWRAVS
ncbi:hypothetical protein FJY69_07310 [candidate division WOR-3 bacterium]|nr:hypothetical protein [candidate division WOR-3 bacterium]